jgi:hypothetical protein
MLPTTLEWHALAGVTAIGGFIWPILWIVALGMLLLSVLVAGIQAYQANVQKQHDGLVSRLLVLVFSYLQPLVRSFHRYRTRLFYVHPTAGAPWVTAATSVRFPFTGQKTIAYWSETGRDRMEMLERVVEFLSKNRWGRIVDSGWTDWDLRIYCHPLVYLQVRTTQENHGGNRRLVRVHHKMRLRDFTVVAAGIAVSTLLLLSRTHPLTSGIVVAFAAAMALVFWIRSTRLAGQTAALFCHVAGEMGMIRCEVRGQVENGMSPVGDKAEYEASALVQAPA